jgi:nitrilase
MDGSSPDGHKVAVVQHPPVLLDREATIGRAVDLVAEAAAAGATLITFPETFVPGYPVWIWRLRPEADYALTHEIHQRLIESAVDLSGDDLAPLARAAEQHRVTVVVGVHERDGAFSRATLYNTVVVIAPDGTVLNRHRKLMPTNPERMVWGLGDAAGLRVVDTSVGRVGALICWENYMPLARFSLYADGVEIYCAPTWDSGDGWLATMRHIAQEGRCWVLGNGTSIQARDIPPDFPGRDTLFPDDDEWLNDGDSVIVSPAGEFVAGPLRQQHGILYADCDPLRAASMKRTLDVTGHYNRPDIFRLEVKRAPLVPVVFDD